MGFHRLWLSNDPALEAHLRKANEARAAVVYALFRAAAGRVSSVVRGVTDVCRRAKQTRRTYRALSELDDRALRDIGLNRDEIGMVARLGGTADPEVGLTIAELRGGEAPGGHAQVIPLQRTSGARSTTARAETMRRPNAA
ncbi:DUF1127 domain-containing protein [Thermohalobaculum sediminis]|uniref:DUF1127 domain-containing protein n=1 Tax=Thermohalobaculum sediminis TaxID=2939436 RepID=UPI0038737FBC